MTEQPSLVPAADMVVALLRNFLEPPSNGSAAELITWHEYRARLPSDVAAVVGTAEAHALAADAWRGSRQVLRHCSDQTGMPREAFLR
jgi:hypothetical protein